MAVKTAGAWRVVDPVGIADLTNVDTTAQYPLGHRCRAFDTGVTGYGWGEFIYLKGVGSTVRGSVVTITDDYLTALAVADAHGAVGVALAIIDAATKFGWYQILGKGVACSEATIVDGTQAYVGATAGFIDDAATAGDQIIGMIISSTTDTATCVMNMTTYPVLAQTNA